MEEQRGLLRWARLDADNVSRAAGTFAHRLRRYNGNLPNQQPRFMESCMSSHTFALMIACTLFMAVGLVADEKSAGASDLNFTVKDIDGKDVNLAEKYKGKVVLVVNVASKCGLTPQYTGLEALQDKYSPKGFAVLGFPCNQFKGQEPGTEAEIKEFCKSKYDVSFDLFKKIDVNGENAAPLYKHLKGAAPDDGQPKDVAWNFEKFLIGRDGKLVKRIRPRTTPEEIAKDIEAELAKPAPKA
jgi:glutathione peroxidase